MNMTKTLLLACVVIVLGITAINGFLFPSEEWENKCYCTDTWDAEPFCNQECASRGGCTGLILQQGKCYDYECWQAVTFFCGDSSTIEGWMVAWTCMDCIDP